MTRSGHFMGDTGGDSSAWFESQTRPNDDRYRVTPGGSTSNPQQTATKWRCPLPAVDVSRDGTELQSSLTDATHGSSHLLLASTMAIESLPALAKVVEPRSGRTSLRCGPVEPVGRQPFVPTIGHARTPEHSIEPRAAPDEERLVRRRAAVGRILKDPTVVLRHLPPFVVGGQPPARSQRLTSSLRRLPHVQTAILTAI
jgi:hypothetical protein